MPSNTNSSSLFQQSYIGSRRDRCFLKTKLSAPTLFSNNYCFLTVPSSKSVLLDETKKEFNVSNKITTESLQEQTRTKYASSPISLEKQQLHQGHIVKNSLSPSSSSPFLFPTAENITILADYDRSSSSLVKEQHKIRDHQLHSQQHPSRQLSNKQNRYNQSHLSDQFKQQQERKQPSIYNQLVNLNDPSETGNSSPSSTLLNNIAAHKSNANNLLTLNPFRLPPAFSHSTFLSDNTHQLSLSPPVLSNKNRTRSASHLQHRLDIEPLNNRSSLWEVPDFDMNRTTTTHSYDQKITDQGDKYIIQLKTDDYQENEFTVTPRYFQNQLIIDAQHNEEDNLGGYIRRELHKVFIIPKNIDMNKYAYSYNATTQELTIEMPYLQPTTNESRTDVPSAAATQNTMQSLTFSYGGINLMNGEHISTNVSPQSDCQNFANATNKNDHEIPMINTRISHNNTAVPSKSESTIGQMKPFDFDLFHRSAFRPQIIHTVSNGQNTSDKKLVMSLDLNDYQPEDIKVSVQDHELIVKAERISETNSRKSRTSFFQSTSLPPQTDINNLKSTYGDGKLTIEAPYLDQRIKAINTQQISGRRIMKSQQNFIRNDPFQQHTQTIVEYVRPRRLRL